MSDKKPRRPFRLTPTQQQFVDDAKVMTDNRGAEHAGRRDTDPVPVPAAHEQAAGRRSVDTHVMQHDTAQHSTTPRFPWEDLSVGGSSINFKFSPEQNAKAEWCGKNVPGGISKLALLRYGLELAFEELKNRHYKPEEK